MRALRAKVVNQLRAPCAGGDPGAVGATQRGAAAPPPASLNSQWEALRATLLALPEHVRKPLQEQMAEQQRRGVQSEDVLRHLAAALAVHQVAPALHAAASQVQAPAAALGRAHSRQPEIHNE